MFFVNDSTGYMCTHNTYIMKTCDGGLSWVQQPLPYYYLAADIFFLNDTVGWAASSGGYFFKTVNGGNKWVKRNTWKEGDWTGIFFLDDDNGFLYRSDGWDSYCIFKTTNDHDWDDITGPGMEYIQDVTFMDYDHGYAVGNCIWYTPDGGYTWSAEKLLTASVTTLLN